MSRTCPSPWLALALSVGASLLSAEAPAQTLPNPTVGGPYGSLTTYACSDLPGSFCHSPGGSDPLGTAGAVLPHMDNAARNWGCQWNLGYHAAVDLGGGNWSKRYGTEFDLSSGCGVVYWNHDRQAAYFLSHSMRGGNVAAAARGATVSVSSTFNAGTPAASLIDGNRRGNVWGSGGGWSSLYNPTPTSPQWIQVNLAGAKTIGEVVVTTLQDNYTAPVEPTTGLGFTTYGIRNFTVQYWNGSAWAALASAVANNSVARRFTFAPVTTAYLRVNITAALQNYARVIEVEAFETPGTSANLAYKYLGLGAQDGVLGYPVSNPSPYGWTGATYQQFTHGIITYVQGTGAALHVGGPAPEEQALALKYADHFGISPTTGPPAYGLREVGCTNASGTGCGEGRTGRYLLWRDAYQRWDEMLIARTGSPTAVLVPGGIRNKWMERYGAAGPWNGELGFPVTDLLPTGSASHHQEFEHGTIVWERSACASGPYTARIVAQFRRPISEANLSMLCEASPPANDQYAPVSAPVPFSVAAGSGSYTFHAGLDASGWYQGASVRFDGAPAIDVTGPFYSAWIGGADGGGNVADALAATGSASDWGEPTGNATCEGNPCTVLKQRFANGLAVLTSGVIVWDPVVEGLQAPIGFGPYERGYVNPPVPFDRRGLAGVHRSGDYIKLAWLNKATLPDVTTRIYRSVTPLNGTPGPWTVIETYPPPTLPAGTSNVYTDLTPPNNSKNCYFIEVSNGFSTETTPSACTFTLDGTNVGGVDRSMVRGVSRAQIEIEIPASPSDSGSGNLVGASLHSLPATGFEFNFTYLDTTSTDFTLGSVRRYDLSLASIHDISDIDGFSITAYGDNLRISSVKLILDNVVVFSKTFSPAKLVSNSYAPGGTRLEVGFDELRSNPLWNSLYSTSPLNFLGFTRDDFRSKVDGILAHVVFNTPGAAYHGSRLRDGYTTVFSKPKFGGSDVIHVKQHIRADAANGIYCTLDYNLRMHARDIYGNEVSAFYGGPYYEWEQPVIYTTEIRIEKPSVDCGSSSFWKGLLKGIFSFGTYPFTMADLEKNLEQSLRGQGPSQIQSSPPKHHHFCFPGDNQGIGGPSFRNGGLTVCADYGY